ncbi:peptidase MA family metallohydrolase [Candidatus Uabimicrobium sp. HlEnr_7]|uniref:peptidase MA family metallohydrolase n=1 Tax=Candidatus Uabimicrobium helgolandensis TaxID=3095367 RepID=UPI00355706F4
MKKNNILLFLVAVTSFIFSQEKVNKLSIEINPKLNTLKIKKDIDHLYTVSCKNIEKKLHLPSPNKVRIVVCASNKEMNILSGHKLPSWALGVAFSSRNLILINYTNVDTMSNSLPSLLEHEVCHLYLGKWEIKNNLQLPQWFNEGICEWISGRLHLQHNTQIFDRAIWDQLIPLDDLKDGFPRGAQKAALAYVQARDIVIYMANKYGQKNITQIIDHYKTTKNFSAAVQKVTNISLAQLEKNWIESITPEYKWFWRLTQLFSLFSIMAILTILAYTKQKKRKKAIVNKWEKEDEFYENIGY